MSEIITDAGASGSGIVVADAPDAQPAPQATSIPSAEQRVAAAIAAMGGQKPAAPAPDAKPAAEAAPQPSLAEVIRAQREAREKAQAAEKQKSSLEQELAKARQELEAAKADRQAFEDDPVGFAKARGWTPEQQLLFGQALLYDLAPDKADPQFRIRMFEDKQKRKEREQTKAQQEAQQRAQAEAVQRQLETYYQDTAKAVQSLPAGSHPEVEDWFGGDTESLMTSLMATARNLSAAATQTGGVADLSPGALMAALEAEVGQRLAARDERKQKRAPAKPAAVVPQRAPGGVQPIETASTKNMNGAGSARPPADSDKERIARAIAAAFRPSR